MPRRAHKKSRLGCTECKKRHIKCDETQPTCVNCRCARLRCGFSDFHSDSTSKETANHHQRRQRSPSRGPSHSTPAPDALEKLTSREFPTIGQLDSVPEINMLHMELFYHFLSDTCKTLLPGELAEIYCRSTTSCAIAHPFLMYTTLAVSAFHLSVLRFSQQAYYQRLAVSYQAKALVNITTILNHVNADNCLAILLFSHHIGIHSFIDLFAHDPSEGPFHSFLDRLVHNIGLMRGIYAVISPWWDTLLTTQIGPILIGSQHSSEHGGETTCLRERIEAAQLTDDNRNTYRQSIISLQHQFDALRHISEDHLATPSTVFAWLMKASSEFLRLLDERRPEPLVILAYYAVLLHSRRKSWVVSDAGRKLFVSISEHLGRWWEPWMEWPRQEILGE